MTSYVTNWSSCVSYSPSCCCVWYYMAKQCFLVTIPNEKLGSLKTHIGFIIPFAIPQIPSMSSSIPLALLALAYVF